MLDELGGRSRGLAVVFCGPKVSADGLRHTWPSRHSPLLGDKAFAESQALYSPSLLQPEFTHLELLSTESSVDDLGTCRGVVLRRAASILRSIETQPLTGRFVRYVGQSSHRFFIT